MKLKITTKNYLLYLVIFTIILFLFMYLFSDTEAIVRQLYKELIDIGGGGGGGGAPLREGFDFDGLSWTQYDGFTTDVIFDTTNLPKKNSGSGAIDFSSIDKLTKGAVTRDSGDRNYSVILTGFFTPNKTGNWTVAGAVDDNCYIWIGDSAKKNWNSSNAWFTYDLEKDRSYYINNNQLKYSNTIILVANYSYPIRIQMSQDAGPFDVSIQWIPPNNKPTPILSQLSSVSNSPSGELQIGLIWKVYKGFFNNNLKYSTLSNVELISNGITSNTSDLSTITGGKIVGDITITSDKNSSFPTGFSITNPTTYDNFTLELTGYFYTKSTQQNVLQTWSFFLGSDDGSYLWIGEKAESDWSMTNVDIDNGPPTHGFNTQTVDLNLMSNTYYYIRILYGNSQGDYNLRFGWKSPSGNWTSNGNGFLYSGKPVDTVDTDKTYTTGFTPYMTS